MRPTTVRIMIAEETIDQKIQPYIMLLTKLNQLPMFKNEIE